jgi:hypothetical protein
MGMSDDLISKVKKWYSTQGYSFEMKSARDCSASGFGVQLGNFFSDPLTGTRRELDLIATRSVECKNSGVRLYIHLLIQCKYATKPWLFFSPSNPQPKPLDPQLLKDAKGDSPICMWPAIPGIPEFGFLCGWQDSAYGVTTVRFKHSSDQGQRNGDESSNKDVAYQALASITSAHEAWTARKSALFSMPGEHVYHITVPVVFVKGQLFTARLIDDDDIIAETNMIRVVWSHREACRGGSVDVVESSVIISYLNQVTTELDMLAGAIREDSALLYKCASPRVNGDDYSDR